MEKTVIGLVAAIGAAAPFAGAQAAIVTSDDAVRALRVASVADLLEPVPNSAAILAALDAQPKAETAGAEAKGVKVAQWHHHHWRHHHHHHYYYHHHHHHHHHHWHRPGCWRTPVGWVCP